MDQYEVVGFQRSQFTAQDNGQVITGVNIYVQCEDPKVTGYKCDRVYLGDGKCDYTPMLGDRIKVNYNRYGKVQSVERL